MKKRYRILKKDGYYYPQWKRFLFWHYFYYEREVGYESYKTEVCTISFQRAEQFCLDSLERDSAEKDRAKKIRRRKCKWNRKVSGKSEGDGKTVLNEKKINDIKNECELMLTLEKSDKQFYNDIIELCEENQRLEKILKEACKDEEFVCDMLTEEQYDFCKKLKLCK